MSTEGYDTLQSPTVQAQHFKRANNRMFLANRGSIGKKLNDDLDQMIRNPSNAGIGYARKVSNKPRKEPKKIEAKIQEGDARANDELEFEGWHSSSQVLAVYGQTPASTYDEAKVPKKK